MNTKLENEISFFYNCDAGSAHPVNHFSINGKSLAVISYFLQSNAMTVGDFAFEWN